MEVASRFISGTPRSTRSWTNIGISKFPCAKAEAMWWKCCSIASRLAVSLAFLLCAEIAKAEDGGSVAESQALAAFAAAAAVQANVGVVAVGRFAALADPDRRELL